AQEGRERADESAFIAPDQDAVRRRENERAEDDKAKQVPAGIDALHEHVLLAGQSELVGEFGEVRAGGHQIERDEQDGTNTNDVGCQHWPYLQMRSRRAKVQVRCPPSLNAAAAVAFRRGAEPAAAAENPRKKGKPRCGLAQTGHFISWVLPSYAGLNLRGPRP